MFNFTEIVERIPLVEERIDEEIKRYEGLLTPLRTKLARYYRDIIVLEIEEKEKLLKNIHLYKTELALWRKRKSFHNNSL